jgi:hypothetical protein
MTRGVLIMVLAATLLAAPVTALSQNRIAIVTDSVSGILPPDATLSNLLSQMPHRFEFLDYVPDPIDEHDYSALILFSRSAAIACQVNNIDRFIRMGGGFLCGGGIPLYLVPSDSVNPIVDWFGCLMYVNSSGDVYATDAGSEFGLTDGMLLDRTECGIAFGGLIVPHQDVDVLAYWYCDGNELSISALTNRFGDGRATYISRVVNTEPLRQLFVRSIGMSLQYVWGDADNSGNVDIDDIVFIIDYIFSNGVPPKFWNAADPSGDGQLDVDDVVVLVGWIFGGDNAPRAGRIE